MKVRLLLTCLCDAFYGEAAIAAVKVLEHAGCEVAFPENQTCCGQPPFNSGDWDAARTIALHCRSQFKGSDPIVCASASCTAMLREGYHLLFPGEPTLPVFELSEFLLDVAKVTAWPQHPDHPRIAFHRSCHGRGIHLGDHAERLLAMAGVELLPFAQAEQCCGFGGAFSATHAKVSSAIGEQKLQCISETGASTVVSGDMGCLMHLGGLIERDKRPLAIRHYAQYLAEAVGS
jgi:L-lactate dehydrogenase complex protein LldE